MSDKSKADRGAETASLGSPYGSESASAFAIGGIAAEALAEKYGTPLYVYDVAAMAQEATTLDAAFDDAPHLVAYAVKANTAGPIISAFAEVGLGADVVSGGELEVALASGITPERILYSGVAKLPHEMARAISVGERGIFALHIESVEEVERVAAVARSLGRRARVGIRVNPEIEEVGTHAHVATGHDEAKFGVALADVGLTLDRIRERPELDFGGLTVHVGSQLVATDDYRAGARRLFDIARALPPVQRSALRFLDTGGGFGIDYGTGCPVTPADFVKVAREEQRNAGLEGIPLFVEPGRRLVAAHGVLLAKVIQTKRARPHPWMFVDAGMNDLLRPALYQARHRAVAASITRSAPQAMRVAGPVCESADDFGLHDLPPDATLVAFRDAGAYGFSMASQYNARALPAEVFVSKGQVLAVFPRTDLATWIASRTR